MNMLHAEYSQTIEAQPDVIYDIFSDYRHGHPAILPKQYFTDLTVEQGGKGAGTVVSGAVRVYGTTYPFHLVVSEPEPGRLMVESDPDTQQVTQFILEPLDAGRTRVTIASDFPASPGFAGLMERLMKPAVTRRIYKAELAQLTAYVQKSTSRDLIQQVGARYIVPRRKFPYGVCARLSFAIARHQNPAIIPRHD